MGRTGLEKSPYKWFDLALMEIFQRRIAHGRGGSLASHRTRYIWQNSFGFFIWSIVIHRWVSVELYCWNIWVFKFLSRDTTSALTQSLDNSSRKELLPPTVPAFTFFSPLTTKWCVFLHQDCTIDPVYTSCLMMPFSFFLISTTKKLKFLAQQKLVFRSWPMWPCEERNWQSNGSDD